MPGFITARILAMIGGGIAGVLAACLIYTVIVKNTEIDVLTTSIEGKNGWRIRLAECIGNTATLRGNQTVLSESIARQNEAVAQLATGNAARAADGAGGRAQAATLATALAAKAAALAKAQAGADMAASTDALILESIK